MYRWVTANDECPANICTSVSEPLTVLIFLAALAMKVRRPLWGEHPRSPRSSYRRLNTFTTACPESHCCRRRHILSSTFRVSHRLRKVQDTKRGVAASITCGKFSSSFSRSSITNGVSAVKYSSTNPTISPGQQFALAGDEGLVHN